LSIKRKAIMSITKSFFFLCVVASLCFSCKDTASKPNTTKEATTTAVAAQPQSISFTVDGMTCAIGCAKTIETKLSEMKGVQKATVDFDKKQAIVQFDAALVTSEDLVKAVEATADGATYKVFDVKTIK
jgi:mercuric ion binding protein